MSESRYYYDQFFFFNPVTCGDFLLYQLGELYGNENTTVTEHRQVCDEISFIVSGKGWFYEEGRRYPVGKGDCFLSFKDEIHRIESDEREPLHFYFIGFRAQSDQKKEKVEWLRRNAPRCLHYEDAEQLFRMMIEESWDTRLFCNDMIGLLLYRLILLLLRFCRADEGTRTFGDAQNNASVVYQLSIYIQTHLCEIDALSRLEETFNYNYKFLSGIFRRAMGETLHAYFLRMRMERARELLEQGRTVTEVAEMLGYSSVHPFSRAYKKYFDTSPSKLP